jgi:hypothetical protein
MADEIGEELSELCRKLREAARDNPARVRARSRTQIGADAA